MLGGMFAGTEESEGELHLSRYETNQLIPNQVAREFVDKTVQTKVFYGMSSDTAMKKHSGKVAEYRSSEGRTVKVPYKGPVHDTVLDILGGLRSSCTYVGAKKLKELSKRTTFVRVNNTHNRVYEK